MEATRRGPWWALQSDTLRRLWIRLAGLVALRTPERSPAAHMPAVQKEGRDPVTHPQSKVEMHFGGVI